MQARFLEDLMGEVRWSRGYSLIEVMVSVLITVIVMMGVYGLLRKGQESAVREPEISALQQNIRGGLTRLEQDLAKAGYKMPGTAAIFWKDGGAQPDEIMILSLDSEVPTAETHICRRGLPCEMLRYSSVLALDPKTMEPRPEKPETAYSRGMTLLAIETEDCNRDERVGIYAFEVDRDPYIRLLGGLSAVNILHRPADLTEVLSSPAGFNTEIHPDCAVIGHFHIVQYRVGSSSQASNLALERRDLSVGQAWSPVADNVEDLQFTYATGDSVDFVDAPPPPHPNNPWTWVTRVKVTLKGRSESANLSGSTKEGVVEAGAHLRRSYSTTVSLRNLIAQVQRATGNKTYN
jgi:prepilin-type N-terminal cleavage/methylation domain-containing protein